MPPRNIELFTRVDTMTILILCILPVMDSRLVRWRIRNSIFICSVWWELLPVSSERDVSGGRLLQRESQEAAPTAPGVRIQEIHHVVHQQGWQEPREVDTAGQRLGYLCDYKCRGHEEDSQEVWQGTAFNSTILSFHLSNNTPTTWEKLCSTLILLKSA